MDEAVHRVRAAMVLGLVSLCACWADVGREADPAAAEVVEREPAVVEREPEVEREQPELARSSEDDVALLAAERELVEKQKHHEAAPLIEQVLERDPNNASAWTLRGMMRLELSDHDEALLSAHKAVALDPNQASAWVVIGVLEQDRDRLVPALVAYHRYLELAPEGRYANVVRKQVARLERKVPR